MRCVTWICFAALICGYTAALEDKAHSKATSDASKDSKNKRQLGEDIIMQPYIFRLSDHQQYERAPPAVNEEQDEDDHPVTAATNRISLQDSQEYRPGQVISINARELLDYDSDRKAPSYEEPLTLQHNYSPQRTLIARPIGASDGIASVGAALSVSDSDPQQIDPDLLALLDQSSRPFYPSKSKTPGYLPNASTKKPVLKRQKQPLQLPQQYLIETTQPQTQQQRQSVRYFTAAVPTKQQESALKIVASPTLTSRLQQRPSYRLASEARAVRPEARARYEDRTRYASSEERPVTYARYQQQQAPAQIIAEQYFIRPVYKPSPNGRYELAHLQIGSLDANTRLEPSKQQQVDTRYVPIQAARNQYEVAIDSAKLYEQSKETRYVQVPRQQLQQYRTQYVQDNHPTEQPIYRSTKKAPSIQIEQNGNSLEEQRSRLPPPKNNRAYTPEEFAALVAAGYSVTPIPVAPLEPIRRAGSETQQVNIDRERAPRVNYQQFTKEDAIEEPIQRALPERRARVNSDPTPRPQEQLTRVTLSPEFLRRVTLTPEGLRRAGLGIRHLPFRGDDAP